MSDLAAIICAVIAGLGLLQSTAAAALLYRFRRTNLPAPASWPPITVLKPLHGDEPLLEEALASICGQDYPALQVVFGVQDRADPALQVVECMQARFPDVEIAVVVDPVRHGRNLKVGNLINMLPMARNDVLLVTDSDMHAPPGYLRSVAAALQTPGTGLVTSIYAGRAASESIVGQLGAAYINRDFLTGTLMSRVLGRRDCLGATMALRRETLERIGGFEALSAHIADDALLGQLVRAQGLEVALAPTIPATTVPETRLGALMEHELRWMRTSRSIAPVGVALSSIQYPLFWATAMLVLSGGQPWAWAGFGLAWLWRGTVAALIDRCLQVRAPLAIWGLPLRDILSISILLASYRSDRVVWRGHEHQLTRFTETRLQPGEG